MVAGVDIGGSRTKACVVSAGEMVAATVLPTDLASPRAMAELALAAIDQTLQAAGNERTHLAAIGVGVPGQIREGTIRHAANLGIDEVGFDLGGYISSATGVATTVENDMRAAAYGAHRLLSAEGAGNHSLVFVGLGTGVSAGIVIDGRIVRGSKGLAGEFGHVPMGTGVACRCGSVGCLETVIGTASLRHAWGDEPGSVFSRAEAGEGKARELVQRPVEFLARAMSWLAAAYDPEMFLIGGGLNDTAPSLAGLVAEEWAATSTGSGLARQLFDPGRIRAWDGDEPVGAYGAAQLAADEVLRTQ